MFLYIIYTSIKINIIYYFSLMNISIHDKLLKIHPNGGTAYRDALKEAYLST
jgi:hypothetical protein